jgi:hypothetical protein
MNIRFGGWERNKHKLYLLLRNELQNNQFLSFFHLTPNLRLTYRSKLMCRRLPCSGSRLKSGTMWIVIWSHWRLHSMTLPTVTLAVWRTPHSPKVGTVNSDKQIANIYMFRVLETRKSKSRTSALQSELQIGFSHSKFFRISYQIAFQLTYRFLQATIHIRWRWIQSKNKRQKSPSIKYSTSIFTAVVVSISKAPLNKIRKYYPMILNIFLSLNTYISVRIRSKMEKPLTFRQLFSKHGLLFLLVFVLH